AGPASGTAAARRSTRVGQGPASRTDGPGAPALGPDASYRGVRPGCSRPGTAGVPVPAGGTARSRPEEPVGAPRGASRAGTGAPPDGGAERGRPDPLGGTARRGPEPVASLTARSGPDLVVGGVAGGTARNGPDPSAGFGGRPDARGVP